MTKTFLILVVLALGAVTSAQAEAQSRVRGAASANLRAASYDGTWDGTVKCLYDPGLWPEDECDIGLAVEIKGKDFRVRQTVRSKKGEVTTSDINPGRFRFTRLATNAVAVAIEQGDDEDGTWIET